MKKKFWLFKCLLLLSVVAGAEAPASAADEPNSGLEVPERIEVFRIYPCGACDELEAFFTREGIPYQLYDLKKDPDAEADYVRNIGRGLLPVTRVRSRFVRGFKPLQVLKLIQGEAIDPPSPDEQMPTGPTPTVEKPKLTPQEITDQRINSLRGTLERIMAQYDEVGKRLGGEDQLLYTEMARPEIEFKVLSRYGTNDKILKYLASGRDKGHYDKTVRKYVTLSRRTVRKRHGRMIAINERLLKKWKEPMEQQVNEQWKQLTQEILAQEVAKAAPEEESGEMETGSDNKSPVAGGADTNTQSKAKSPEPSKHEEIMIVR